MAKDEDFFNENEKKDYELLTLFNEKLRLNKLGKTPRKWYYDASGYTSLNTYTEIELKNRKGKYKNETTVELVNRWGGYYDSTTIFIEPQHYARMKDDWWFDGVVPMYVNFMEDGTILVWNLSTLKKKPQWEWVSNIKDKGNNTEKGEWRILLPVDEAYIYNKDYILISKPQ